MYTEPCSVRCGSPTPVRVLPLSCLRVLETAGTLTESTKTSYVRRKRRYLGLPAAGSIRGAQTRCRPQFASSRNKTLAQRAHRIELALTMRICSALLVWAGAAQVHAPLPAPPARRHWTHAAAPSLSDSRERGSKRVWASSSVCVRSGVLCFAGFGAPIELRAPCVAFGAPCVAFGAPCVAF